MDNRGFDALTLRIFTSTSRRSALAGLAALAVLIGMVTGPDAAAQRSQRRGKRCRAVGQRCTSGQRPGCCGKAACRRGRCRCGKHQKPCNGHCINKKRRCTCPGQQQKCARRCVNLKTAKAHCGACGNACAGTAVCKQGACVAGGAYREVRRWGGEVDGHVLSPVGITMSRAGLLYVTDFQPTSGRIWVFTANGDFIESWPTAVHDPVSIDISPSGVIYVSHNGGPGTIETFSLDGTPGITFAADGPPVGLAVGRNDDVYVAIPLLNQIQRFTADGSLIKTWEGDGYNLEVPFWVATAPNGDVYVAELFAEDRQVKRFSATGRSSPVGTFRDRSRSRPGSRLMTPALSTSWIWGRTTW